MNVAKEVSKTKIALAAYGQMELAPRMQAYARSNAPWHDISGNARASLKGGTLIRGNKIIIYIAGGMDYSVWLELANDGKYAILDPTIEHFKAEARRTYERIMRT
jgi:hypothetical protein